MTAPISAAGQYASALPFLGKSHSNLASSGEDHYRIRAYELYEDLYHNRPDTFKVFMRGDDEEAKPIYIPSAKKLIEATLRFLCKDFDFVVSSRGGEETAQAVAETDLFFRNLFKREKMPVKFKRQVRYGLIRGDSLWHVTADPLKEPGKRISVHELNPANYFAIADPDNDNRILGCHIVDIVQDFREPDKPEKQLVRRQTYLRKGAVLASGGALGYEMEEGSTQVGVTHEVTHWEIGKWDDRNMKKGDLKQISAPDDKPPTDLPAGITTIPVYHWQNNAIPGGDFGLSEIAGIETLINAVNQSVNDEDLTLVMQGLGLYWTNSKPPVNADGTQGDWEIGPGVVLETPLDGKVERLNGVSSVQPYQDHVGMLKADMQESIGIPDIAAGKVDVAIAESGVSLMLQLAPIIAKNHEKEEEILAVTDQMLYDLATQWFPAIEQFTPSPGVTVASVVGDPMPLNRDSKIQEVVLLQTSGLITIAQAQAQLATLGYSFVSGDDQKVVREAAAMNRAKLGESDNRFAQELEAEVGELAPNVGQSSAPQINPPATGAPTGIAVPLA